MKRFLKDPTRLIGTLWQFSANPETRFLVQVLAVVNQEALVVAVDQAAFPLTHWRVPLYEMLEAKFKVFHYVGTAKKLKWVHEGAYITSKSDGMVGIRGAWRIRQIRAQQVRLETKYFAGGQMSPLVSMEGILANWRPATANERYEAQRHYNRVEHEIRRLSGTIIERLHPPPVPVVEEPPAPTTIVVEERLPEPNSSTIWDHLLPAKPV